MSGRLPLPPCRIVGQRANRVAFDLVRDIEQSVYLRDSRIARDHPLHDPPYPTQTLAARGALATTLVLVKFGKPGDGLDDIRRFVHDDHGGGAQRALDRLQTVEI